MGASTLVRTRSACLVAAPLVLFVAGGPSCGTDAVGVEVCRDIEGARCEAGKHCGFVDDVAACKRLYRDQCLHGMASGKEPGKIQAQECAAVIRGAGDCAAGGVSDPTLCPAIPAGSTSLTSVCDVVKRPEAVMACDFLYKPVQVVDAGSG